MIFSPDLPRITGTSTPDIGAKGLSVGKEESTTCIWTNETLLSEDLRMSAATWWKCVAASILGQAGPRFIRCLMTPQKSPAPSRLQSQKVAREVVKETGKIQRGKTVEWSIATAEQRSYYEPVDKVPFPNSSRIISERSVQFLKASETWLRSIMKADCSCKRETRVRSAQPWASSRGTLETDSRVCTRVKTDYMSTDWSQKRQKLTLVNQP